MKIIIFHKNVVICVATLRFSVRNHAEPNFCINFKQKNTVWKVFNGILKSVYQNVYQNKYFFIRNTNWDLIDFNGSKIYPKMYFLVIFTKILAFFALFEPIKNYQILDFWFFLIEHTFTNIFMPKCRNLHQKYDSYFFFLSKLKILKSPQKCIK